MVFSVNLSIRTRHRWLGQRHLRENPLDATYYMWSSLQVVTYHAFVHPSENEKYMKEVNPIHAK